MEKQSISIFIQKKKKITVKYSLTFTCATASINDIFSL